MALCSPTSRGSTHDPPKSTDSPRRLKISEKRASSLATMRSQPRARLQPAPTATPRTLAIVGFAHRWRARAALPTNRMATRGASCVPVKPDRSAPEQKSPPAPVTTSTLSSAACPTSVKTSRSSAHIVGVAAFLRSGRFMVTVTTPPERPTRSVSTREPYRRGHPGRPGEAPPGPRRPTPRACRK